MYHNRKSNKITLFIYLFILENGSYALCSSFFKVHMAYKMACMKVALLAFKGLLAYGKWNCCV
jgi:hypothetical protein